VLGCGGEASVGFDTERFRLVGVWYGNRDCRFIDTKISVRFGMISEVEHICSVMAKTL
jgi:hypothetical protein